MQRNKKKTIINSEYNIIFIVICCFSALCDNFFFMICFCFSFFGNSDNDASVTKQKNNNNNDDEIKRKEVKITQLLYQYILNNETNKFIQMIEKISNNNGLNLDNILNNNKIGNNQSYLIIEAASYNNLSIVKTLLQHNINVNVKRNDNIGATNAIYGACYNNNTQMCQLLMKYGSNPNIIDKKTNQTPMHIAAYKGNVEIMKLLLNDNNVFKYTFDWVKFAYVLYYIILYYIMLFV